MTPTDDWTDDEIAALTSEDEIHVSSIRRDGSARPPVTMWMVTDGGSVYVRAVKGVDGPWYRHVRATDHAHVTARGVTADVVVEDASARPDPRRPARRRLPREVPALLAARTVGSVLTPAARRPRFASRRSRLDALRTVTGPTSDNGPVSLFTDHPRARWALPAAAVVLIAAGSLVATRTASADSGLPPRTAAQLLVDVQQRPPAQPVRHRRPDREPRPARSRRSRRPGQRWPGRARAERRTSPRSSPARTPGGSGSADPTQPRVALVGGLGRVRRHPQRQRRLGVVQRRQVRGRTTRSTAKDAAEGRHPPLSPTDLPKTPDEAAQQALAAIDPTTQVTTAGTAVVAGRQAYELVLNPRTKDTRVAQVRIAVDAEKHVPLRVQVYSTKLANPAFEVGFTAVDFATPDARQFAFTPPPGTKVTESGDTARRHGRLETRAREPAEPKVVGTGWSAVVVGSPLSAQVRRGQPAARTVERAPGPAQRHPGGLRDVGQGSRDRRHAVLRRAHRRRPGRRRRGRAGGPVRGAAGLVTLPVAQVSPPAAARGRSRSPPTTRS